MQVGKIGLLLGAFLLFIFLIGVRTLLTGVYFCNQGIGFGLLPDARYFLGVEVLLMGVVGILLYRSQRFSERILFSILLVGGAANIFERLYFGCVLDYLTIPIIESHINGADILISVALILLLFSPSKNDV